MNLRSALSLSVIACALAFTSAARADSLPACPPGTHMVANPTPPGSMHHGGAHCDPDVPTAGTPPSETPPATAASPTTTEEPGSQGMCSVRGGADRSLLALGLVSGALLFVRRRR